MTTQKADDMSPEASPVPSRARSLSADLMEGVTSWNLE